MDNKKEKKMKIVAINEEGRKEFLNIVKQMSYYRKFPDRRKESSTDVLLLEDNSVCINTIILEKNEMEYRQSRYSKDTFIAIRKLLNQIKFKKESKKT